MGNGNAKPSNNEPNYNHDEWDTARSAGGRQSRHNSADERRVNPSSPRASPRRSLSARKESPAPSTVPTLSRESTASLGQRIARHAKQQDALDGPEYDDTEGYENQKFQQRSTKVADRFREDDMASEEMEPEDEEWQPQYGGQNHRQREVPRRDPVAGQRRKGVTFDDALTQSIEDTRVKLPPLVNNTRSTNGKRFPTDQFQTPSAARISRSISDREFRTVTEADVRDKLMNNGRLQTRFAEPQNPRNSQWAMDDDNASNYSSSTASLASRPSRIPQRTTTAPRRAPAPVLPPLDSDTLSTNGQLNSSRPIRRPIPNMNTIPIEANFYHLYHHGIPKKSKRTQQRQW